MKVHCFFEQSGTFKNEFIKLGFNSFDYDLHNDFLHTDYIIDLFNQIELAYSNKFSIFDSITKGDLIFAFFPCVRFSHRMILNYKRSKISKYFAYDDILKTEENIRFFNECAYMYELVSKLAIICLRKGIKLIIENPYNERHILTQFWYFKASIIHLDRTLFGDTLKKPTQYFFIGFQPKQNVLFEPLTAKPCNIVSNLSKVERSLISSEYAYRFIKTYIID